MELFPWQQSQWQVLAQSVEQQRLPHALLLCGPPGVGKEKFARSFAHYLLCEQRTPDLQPCGRCRSCLLFAAGTHPDYTVCEPEEAGKVIQVDVIRQMSAKLGMASQYAGFKVVLVIPAEQMNVSAANGLLKTLEEPTERTVLLLVSSHPDRLLPTVRSRCQKIMFPVPERGLALAWLQDCAGGHEFPPELLLDLAAGAPLTALELAKTELLAQRAELVTMMEQLTKKDASPLEAAESLKGLDLQRMLYWLMGWTADMIRLKFPGSQVRLENPDLSRELERHAARADLPELFRFADMLQESHRLARTQVNDRMLMEEVFCSWADMHRRHA